MNFAARAHGPLLTYTGRDEKEGETGTRSRVREEADEQHQGESWPTLTSGTTQVLHLFGADFPLQVIAPKKPSRG